MEIRNSFNMQFAPISVTSFPGSPLLTHPVLGASPALFLSSLQFPGDLPFLIPRPQITVLPPSLILFKQPLQQPSPLDVCDLEGTRKILPNYTGQLVKRFPNASSPTCPPQGLESPAVLVPRLEIKRGSWAGSARGTAIWIMRWGT